MKIIINDLEFNVVEQSDFWKLSAKSTKTDTSLLFSRRDFPTIESVECYLKDNKEF